MGKNMDTVKERARARWDKLTDEDLDTVKEGVGAFASRLSERYGFDGEEARRQTEKLFDSASEMAASAYDRTIAGTTAASSKVDAMVKEYPWRALAGALVVGVLAGLALGSGGRRDYW